MILQKIIRKKYGGRTFSKYKANRDATYNDPNWKGGPVFKFYQELLYQLQNIILELWNVQQQRRMMLLPF